MTVIHRIVSLQGIQCRRDTQGENPHPSSSRQTHEFQRTGEPRSSSCCRAAAEQNTTEVEITGPQMPFDISPSFLPSASLDMWGRILRAVMMSSVPRPSTLALTFYRDIWLWLTLGTFVTSLASMILALRVLSGMLQTQLGRSLRLAMIAVALACMLSNRRRSQQRPINGALLLPLPLAVTVRCKESP